MTNELREKFLTAKNAEEAAEIAKAAGLELTEPELRRLMREIGKKREQGEKALSLDELEAASGGSEERDWLTDGCAATVEPGSWCRTNDSCVNWSVNCLHAPTDLTCPSVGRLCTFVTWNVAPTRATMPPIADAITAAMRQSSDPAGTEILAALAAEYPQLYLNPDEQPRETYRGVVLRGEAPKSRSLVHYAGDPYDRMETADTPAGPVRVVTLGNRRDFELVLRALMAARNGPEAPIPESQGAAMLTLFNWPRINAYLAKFPEEEQTAAFRRFTSVKENYTDRLVVLSRGPYSGVSAQALGCAEEGWLALSDTIRRYHELTHVICRHLYPDDIDPVRDELIADAVGLYATFGRFDPETEKRFLGIRDGRYVGGRLENYTAEPEKYIDVVACALDRYKSVIDARPGAAPFDLIPALMQSVDVIR